MRNKTNVVDRYAPADYFIMHRTIKAVVITLTETEFLEVHGTTELPKGLVLAILKQAGIKEK